MTPNELLEEVKGRFAILLHDDETKLAILLKQAIGKYQDLAGFMVKARIEETAELLESKTTSVPERLLTRVIVKDAGGRYVKSEVWGDTLELGLRGLEAFPLLITYFENVREADFATYALPDTSIALISDYLEILIAKPNAERQRRIAIAGKLDASDIPTEQDLAARKAELEENIKNSRAILPTISLF